MHVYSPNYQCTSIDPVIHIYKYTYISKLKLEIETISTFLLFVMPFNERTNYYTASSSQMLNLR